MTVSDVLLEVLGCRKTLTAEFTVMGNLLVNPVMLRKIFFPDGPSTPGFHLEIFPRGGEMKVR